MTIAFLITTSRKAQLWSSSSGIVWKFMCRPLQARPWLSKLYRSIQLRPSKRKLKLKGRYPWISSTCFLRTKSLWITEAYHITVLKPSPPFCWKLERVWWFSWIQEMRRLSTWMCYLQTPLQMLKHKSLRRKVLSLQHSNFTLAIRTLRMPKS